MRSLPSLDPLAEASKGAQVDVAETRDDGWSLVHVRWSDLQVSLQRLERGDERFGAQVEAIGALVQAGVEPGGERFVLETRIAATRHVVGVATEPAPRGEDDETRIRLVLSSLLGSVNGVAVRDGILLDSELRVLVRPGHAPDPKAKLRVLDSARARKARSLERIEPLKIEAPPKLPALYADEEAEARPAQAIARRAQALWAVTVRACGAVEQKPAVDLLQKRGLWDAATEREQEFLLEGEPGELEVLRYTSRREALAALLWALGHTRLPEPTEMCNLEVLTRVLRNAPAEEFVDQATLRTLEEILDEADFVYRCHGAVVQALVNGEKPPGGLKISVVRERHAAFHWLLGTRGQSWDAVADGRE